MPKLFVARHAIAQDRKLFARKESNDDLRPLTAKGYKQMERVMRQFKNTGHSVDIIVQSPLLRSQQTAEIFLNHFPKCKLFTFSSLRPESKPSLLANDLRVFKNKNVAVVGHEDHLSLFTHFLLTGEVSKNPFLKFKKGGIACLDYQKSIAAKKVLLEWLMTPNMFDKK